MFYFHILELNVNEWVPIKDVYWGYGQMDPVWSLLLLLRPWMGYGYTGCMLGRAPRTKETLPDFL